MWPVEAMKVWSQVLQYFFESRPKVATWLSRMIIPLPLHSEHSCSDELADAFFLELELELVDDVDPLLA